MGSRPSGLPVPQRAAVWVDGGRTLATTDERFLSFAVDTAQVVGGEFWAPRGKGEGLLKTAAVGSYDFSRPQLRQLAAGLAPAYLRVGGTDADRTVYRFDDGPGPDVRARGARWVLTRQRWDALAGFARDLDLKIAFTLNAGQSARTPEGLWDPESARGLVEYAQKRGDDVALWELGNEVNAFPLMHRMWLTPARYARDLVEVRALLDEVGARGRLGGPSSAFWPLLGEGRGFGEAVLGQLQDAGRGDLVDVVTWHYYPQQSHRCPVATRRAQAGRLPAPAQLDDVERWAGEVEGAAGAYAPRAEVWLGETGSAQCGGEPGLSNAYADSLWWVDQLGRLARRGQRVVIRQTLSGSDYGLIDDATLAPNPSYWASWLWRQLVGTRVLSAGTTPTSPGLMTYAHCARAGAVVDAAGAVTLIAVNFDPVVTARAALPRGWGAGARAWQLTAEGLSARQVALNGRTLAVNEGGLPALAKLATAVESDEVVLAPQSIAFVVMPAANAAACR
jgi:hypothetical protein